MDEKINSSIDWNSDESEEDENYDEIKYDIFSYPSDTTLKGYQDQEKSKQLYIPKFQRKFIWDQVRASKLIESFLLGLPVPPVFLYKKMNSKEFWIIDGQQRIMSVVSFLNEKFNDRAFRLRGVNKKWDGKLFSELDESERFDLQTSVLRAIIIQQTNVEDLTSIYQIFERLNTGGVRLNPMEVRQCVSSGYLLDKIEEQNKNQNWRNIIGFEQPDKRIRDRELILRIFSLSLHQNEYQKPMKGFLNKISERYKGDLSKNPDLKIKIDKFFENFSNVLDEIHKQIGEKPFHYKSRLNYGAIDSIISILCRNMKFTELNKKFSEIFLNQEYIKNITISTSDEISVSKRFKIAEEIFNK